MPADDLQNALTKLGTTVAVSMVTTWAGGPVAIGAATSVGALLGFILDSSTSHRERRRVERQIEGIVDDVLEKLEPIFAAEFAFVPRNDRTAAVLEANQTLTRASVGLKDVLESDLDATRLETFIREHNPHRDLDAHLGEPASRLYDLLLREISNYLVEIMMTLPQFGPAALKELIQREGHLSRMVQDVLSDLPALDADSGTSTNEDTIFEDRYRRDLSRKLDHLELFGIDLTLASRRYPLSVAYITLSASTSSLALPSDGPESDINETTDTGSAGETSEEAAYVRVNEAVAGSNRLLVRGEAGSGKTTLLQWLAVQACRRKFDAPLNDWNHLTPFFIQLRRYVEADFPGPDEFVSGMLKPLSGMVPDGWVHRHLDAGSGLILVDGVDELPDERRSAARQWLEDLTISFPQCRYVVTSRPAAVDEDWLGNLHFKAAELQPMTLGDIDAFIDHWHDAAVGTPLAGEPDVLFNDLRHVLKLRVRESPPIRNLATTPLLCAMLCALSRDRRTQLPKERMELYAIALESLLERRDLERAVHAPAKARLSYRQKQELLQAFAFWLLLNGQSDAARDSVIKCFDTEVSAMPGLQMTGAAVFSSLLERSGLLREPIEGRIDFVHRTFQEYLGAKEAVDGNHIGLLIEKAHLDQWREVVVLAAGHAIKHQRKELIGGLLDRGDASPLERHRLHPLALACLETPTELDPDTHDRVLSALPSLLPPRNMSQAKAVASAGDLAVPLLAEYARGAGARVAAACVRSLSTIGTEAAFHALARFGRDKRVTVTRELIRGWAQFDPDKYAQNVLADSPLIHGALRIGGWGDSLAPLQHLRKLRALYLLFLRRDEVDALRGLRIERLRIYGTNVTDFEFLRELPLLKHLGIALPVSGIDITALNELTVLTHLQFGAYRDRQLALDRGALSLKSLEIFHAADLERIDIHADQLEEVWLEAGCLRDLSFLSQASQLRQIGLRWCGALQNLNAISGSAVEKLSVESAPLSNVDFLQHCPRLKYLRLAHLPTSDLTPLSGAKALIEANIDDCSEVEQVSFAPVSGLRRIAITNCERLTAFEGGNPASVASVELQGCAAIKDPEFLAAYPKLVRLDLSRSGIGDVSFVSDLRRLRTLSIWGCSSIQSLAPLESLVGLSVYIDADQRHLVSPRIAENNVVRVSPRPPYWQQDQRYATKYFTDYLAGR